MDVIKREQQVQRRDQMSREFQDALNAQAEVVHVVFAFMFALIFPCMFFPFSFLLCCLLSSCLL